MFLHVLSIHHCPWRFLSNLMSSSVHLQSVLIKSDTWGILWFDSHPERQWNIHANHETAITAWTLWGEKLLQFRSSLLVCQINQGYMQHCFSLRQIHYFHLYVFTQKESQKTHTLAVCCLERNRNVWALGWKKVHFQGVFSFKAVKDSVCNCMPEQLTSCDLHILSVFLCSNTEWNVGL